ncbi:MAG: GGDEF domain-containing protein [Neomegalonema sp.]|nr:GGDEF domain-containing protein [Neomegalonema sp.]
MTTEKTYDFAHAEKLALTVLDTARAHNTPLVPEAYRVWFEYAAGTQPSLKERIDAIVETAQRVSPPELRRVHEEFFEAEMPDSGMDRLTNRLNAELEDVIQLLQSNLSSQSDFMGTLGEVDQQLSVETQAKDLKTLVTLLLAKNRQFYENSREFHDHLQNADDEIKQIRRELEELRQDAFVDHLTQIPNRRHLDKILREEMDRARQSKKPLCLAIADVDHFKKFNDTWGHHIGDVVLKQTARILSRNVKGRDTAGRFGGEEFMIILPETSLRNARNLCDQMRKTLEKLSFVIKSSNQHIKDVTASFGVTVMRPDDNEASLIERADKHLYKAKENGRNRIVASD